MPRVLVIEDVPDSALLARRILVANNYDVLEATDGESGYDMAVAHQPDLILLDLGLPDIDGQTLLGQLRRVPELATTPVIAFTAWPKETAEAMVTAYGCDDYISKPISDVNGFMTKIAACLR